jgi:hypothetical protein
LFEYFQFVLNFDEIALSEFCAAQRLRISSLKTIQSNFGVALNQKKGPKKSDLGGYKKWKKISLGKGSSQKLFSR